MDTPSKKHLGPLSPEQTLAYESLLEGGKMRASMEIEADLSEGEIKKLALVQENVIKWLGGVEPKKVIYVKGKLVSVVV